jgi:murein DD-endopeptidase MepM/ murein hydrolase activator NlpD
MAAAEPSPQIDRRTLIGAGLAALAARPALAGIEPGGFTFGGRLSQGGVLIGRAAPRATVLVNGKVVGRASADGIFAVGFDRDEPATAEVDVLRAGGEAGQRFAIAPVSYDVQRINGLPQDQVTPTDPALLERIAREATMKADAFASTDDTDNFKDGFERPVAWKRISARFGGQRVLDGVPQTPHMGIDLAAPKGTPIRAPAGGLVVLAEPDMHYEGGLTLIDHGQGLVAAYLHQSQQFVRAGDRVVRGQRIGLVGMTGRATGPHLCWRMKWRGRNLDPSLMIGAAAPAA